MFDSFKLKKSSWHMKMMNYIWDLDHRDFSHMCPYFWLSIANLFIIIPFALIKELIFKPFKYIGKYIIKLANYIENSIDARREAIMQAMLSDIRLNKETALDKYAKLCKKDYERLARVVYFDLDNNLDWDTYNLLNDKRENYLYAQSKPTEIKFTLPFKKSIPELNLKKKVNTIYKYIKPIVTVLMYIIGLIIVAGLLFLSYKLILWFINLEIKWTFNWKSFLNVLKQLGIGILIIVIVAALLAALLVAIKKFITCKVKNKIKNGFNWVGSLLLSILTVILIPFIWIFNGLITLKQIVYTLYKNECPPIDWMDDENIN